MPRAIVITTVVCGVLFVMISGAAQLFIPDERDITDPDAAAFQIMSLAAGRWLEVFFLVAYLAGCFGAAIAAQVGVTRILYAMGRDGVLPRKVFGILSARFNTPVGATVFVAVISLSALVADLATIATLISFGALAAFSLVNLCSGETLRYRRQTGARSQRCAGVCDFAAARFRVDHAGCGSTCPRQRSSPEHAGSPSV